MKHKPFIFIILLFAIGCAGLVEEEMPVDGVSKKRSSIPDPHLVSLTKAGSPGSTIPQSLTSDPDYILLSFTDWEEGHPVLRIDQSMAMQMGIDSVYYQSFVNQLNL